MLLAMLINIIQMQKNRKAWVDKFHDEAVKKGMILGNGTAIHAHGTTTELRNKMPKPI